MANRTRNIRKEFNVTEEEWEMIQTKMKQYGTDNFGAYIRKMAIDGYVIKKDYVAIRKLTAELGKIGSNINQIAKRANESRQVYEPEIKAVLNKQAEIENLIKSAISKLV